jgi:hypothetical protein
MWVRSKAAPINHRIQQQRSNKRDRNNPFCSRMMGGGGGMGASSVGGGGAGLVDGGGNAAVPCPAPRKLPDLDHAVRRDSIAVVESIVTAPQFFLVCSETT